MLPRAHAGFARWATPPPRPSGLQSRAACGWAATTCSGSRWTACGGAWARCRRCARHCRARGGGRVSCHAVPACLPGDVPCLIPTLPPVTSLQHPNRTPPHPTCSHVPPVAAGPGPLQRHDSIQHCVRALRCHGCRGGRRGAAGARARGVRAPSTGRRRHVPRNSTPRGLSMPSLPCPCLRVPPPT